MFDEKAWYKITFGLIKKIFIGILIRVSNASNHTKCFSLSSQKCITQPTLINSNLNDYSQEFYYYPICLN